MRVGVLVTALLCIGLLGAAAPAPHAVEEFSTNTALNSSPLKQLEPRSAWRQVVPEVKEVRIRSTADGAKQPAMFYAPPSEQCAPNSGPRPLLVVLHSWSVSYLDPSSAPYGLWAVRNGWAFIHPDYRGRFDNPKATGSELAVQDVLDAVNYARRHADVDPERIYLVGYSGGGMMALSMAGRFPELWAGVVAWVPVFDLVQWHQETRRRHPHYAREIRASCGGEPAPGSKAEAECRRRSPKSYLPAARGTGVRVYIAAGIQDPFVSPAHSLDAFNALADEKDRFTAAQIEQIAKQKSIPEELNGSFDDTKYEEAGRPLLLRRTSGQVTLHLYRGRHDVIYNAGLLWLADLRRQSGP